DDPTSVSIDELIHRLRARALKNPELRQLQERHDEYWASVPLTGAKLRKRKSPSFIEWYNSDHIPRWKFGWWDVHDNESKSTAQTARERHDVVEIDDFIPCEHGQLKRGDWVLCFRLGARSQVSEPSWLRVDFVNSVTAAEEKDKGYPQEAVQLRPLTSEHRRPFDASLPML